MIYLDERVGLPRTAWLFLPLLLLPVTAVLLMLLLPGGSIGAVVVIAATVALAWNVLGGVIAISHLSRRFATRRAIAAIKENIISTSEPTWVCDRNGYVLLQNLSSIEQFGKLNGQHIQAFLQRRKADAASAFSALTRKARLGHRPEMVLSDDELLRLSQSEDGLLYIWMLCRRDHANTTPSSVVQSTIPKDILEAIPVSLLRLSRSGTILSTNLAARNMLARHLPVDTGQSVLLDMILDGLDQPISDWLQNLNFDGNETRSELLRCRRNDGDTEMASRYFRLTVSADLANPPGLIAVLTDASELKTLEAQFVQSQKMQAIGQLAGGIAHDFNNLLTAISGHCDLLMLRHDKADPDYADLDQISQNANRAASLVGQLLSFSRKQKLQLEQLQLREILADLTHLLNRLVVGRVSLAIIQDPELKPIRADRRLLEQVIMNLVVNARDAMPDGGEIRIETRNLVTDAPLTRDRLTLPAGEYVCVSVHDQGCGIDTAFADKIFEPFFTTKPVGEGTGLGLSTVYGIVRQTGGYIHFESEMGQGTSFHIYFAAQSQVAKISVPATRPLKTRNAAARKTGTVLLVEDEASVRSFTARALRLKGYVVLEADGAEAALQLLSNGGPDIDIFVTDVVMPGMDGPSWVREALKNHPQTKVVFMSGYSEEVFSESQTPVANSVFLAKPFTLAEFTTAVEDLLNAPEDKPIVTER